MQVIPYCGYGRGEPTYSEEYLRDGCKSEAKPWVGMEEAIRPTWENTLLNRFKTDREGRSGGWERRSSPSPFSENNVKGGIYNSRGNGIGYLFKYMKRVNVE